MTDVKVKPGEIPLLCRDASGQLYEVTFIGTHMSDVDGVVNIYDGEDRIGRVCDPIAFGYARLVSLKSQCL